jgi:prepilin-type N-terminal cleavage/methylation domain-containing protein
MRKGPIPSLRAFTVLELIIVMMLTGILVSMGYTLLRIFSFQQQQYTGNITLLQDYFLLKKRMDRDFFNARILEQQGQHALICRMEQEDVKYDFIGNERIIRVTGLDTTDVFHIGHQISDWDILEEANLSLVEGLEVDLLIKDNRFPLVFTKQYDATTLLNLQHR